MLKYGFMAVLAATAIAAALVLLPVASNGPRPEPKLLNDPNAPAPGSFVIKPASPPPAPAPAPAPTLNITPTGPGNAFQITQGTAPPAAPATPPPSTTDLDALMQKLRASAAQPDATASTTVTPAPDATPAPPPAPVAPVAPPPPPPPRWTSVTGQGTRWRMVRSPAGFTVSIDLGNGQTADVRVLPQFGNLDLAATNMRIDYLKQTILSDFSGQPGTYTYARDGSVSVSQ